MFDSAIPNESPTQRVDATLTELKLNSNASHEAPDSMCAKSNAHSHARNPHFASRLYSKRATETALVGEVEYDWLASTCG